MHKRGIADHNQLTGVLHRDRFQQECIHQAENRGVRADTQRQRSYNDEHERGRSPKYSQRITQIFQQDFPRRPPNTSKMARSDWHCYTHIGLRPIWVGGDSALQESEHRSLAGVIGVVGRAEKKAGSSRKIALGITSSLVLTCQLELAD